MKWNIRIVAAGLMLGGALFCSSNAFAQRGSAALKCTIEGTYHEVQVITFPQGHPSEWLKPEVEKGHFVLAFPSVESFLDLVVEVDGSAFGARVLKSDTLQMTLAASAGGRLSPVYSGTTLRESRIWTDWYKFYGWRGQYNIGPNRNPKISCRQSLKLLRYNDSLFYARWKTFLDDYHRQRADCEHSLLLAMLLEDSARVAGVEAAKLPEYVTLMSGLDPNGPMAQHEELLMHWASYAMSELGDREITCALGFMRRYQGKITNAEARKKLADYCAQVLVAHPERFSDNSSKMYIDALRRFAPDCTDAVRRCEQAYQTYKENK